MMKLLRIVMCVLWAGIAAGVLHPAGAYANATESPENATQDPSQASGQVCMSDSQFTEANLAQNIIQQVFCTINTMLGHLATVFYTNIVGSTEYQGALNAAVMLYITVYGVLIMFNIANTRGYDVMVRLMKIGFVYGIMGGTGASGFSFFYQWVGGPFISGMNELIGFFITLAQNGGSSSSPVHVIGSYSCTSPLDYNAMGVLFNPMSVVMSSKFFTAFISLFFQNGPSLTVGFIMGWALLNFIYLLIGAIATYLKSIIGLAFLFGIAPIFCVFILFEKSRQVFLGWLNQVVAFSLQPTMLFAFLAFYLVLIETALGQIITNTTDYCFTPITTLPGGSWTIYGWRPTINGTVQAGDFMNTSGDLPPVPSMLDACYFFILCHLGYSFSKFIQEIAQNISSGVGPGYASPEAVEGKLKKALGSKGISQSLGGIFSRTGPS